MRRIFAFGLVATMTVAGVAYAGGETGNGRQQASTAQDSHSDPNEMICKQQPPPTGSRIPAPPVCHTRAQWDQMAHDSEEQLEKMQSIKTRPQ